MLLIIWYMGLLAAGDVLTSLGLWSSVNGARTRA
jgi:hypothetical protein